jgi:hypothetical protein
MWTIDKKKASFSPKYSFQEHHDEQSDDNNRETKNIDEIPIEEVRSFNKLYFPIANLFLL